MSKHQVEQAGSGRGTMLQVDELALERGGSLLLENLSFSVDSGDCLRISGANGIGKTTLLRTLCGISRPLQGTIDWANGSPNYEGSQGITYLGHQAGMKDTLTVKENLQVFCGLHGTQDENLLAASIRRVGLAAMAGRRFQNLSAGQRRRVALASLCMSPNKAWLLDEPFTALDPVGIELVETMIAEHLETGGCVIFTAHSDTGPLSKAKVLDLDQFKCNEKPKGRLYGNA